MAGSRRTRTPDGPCRGCRRSRPWRSRASRIIGQTPASTAYWPSISGGSNVPDMRCMSDMARPSMSCGMSSRKRYHGSSTRHQPGFLAGSRGGEGAAVRRLRFVRPGLFSASAAAASSATSSAASSSNRSCRRSLPRPGRSSAPVGWPGRRLWRKSPPSWSVRAAGEQRELHVGDGRQLRPDAPSRRNASG